MKKSLVGVMVCGLAVAACTTDPYTGQSKLSNTAGGAVLGAGLGALAGLAVGGSPEKVVGAYRRKVRANRDRLVSKMTGAA